MALTTVPDKTAGDLFTEAMWDTYIKDNINELIGRSGGGNLLVNGGMEICQRGAGPFNGGGTPVVGLDCWKGNRTNVAGTSQVAMSQDATTVDANSVYAMKCVVTYTAITSEVYQKLEEVVSLRSKTLTFAIRINQAIGGFVAPFFRVDGVKTGGGASATTGSWLTLSQSATLGASVATLEVGVDFGAVSGTAYLDNAVLVVGATVATYVPRHPQEELARCQRYYELVQSDILGLSTAAGANYGNAIPYRQEKAGTPTVTKNGTWGVTNCGQPSVVLRAGSEQRMVMFLVSATAAGAFEVQSNGPTTTISVEHNP